jgi:hypothetical protein
VGAPRRTVHPAPPRVSLVPGAGMQTVGEGLQAPVLTAMQLPPARAPPTGSRIVETDLAGVSFGVSRSLTFGGQMDEDKHAKLKKLQAELESTQEVLREAMDFINDDRKLTVEGIRLREALRREMEEIKKDVEAVRQEHRAD